MDPWGGVFKHTVTLLFLPLKVALPLYCGELKRVFMDGLDSLDHTHQLLGALLMPFEMCHLADPLHHPRFGHCMDLQG